jgi:hypothetical protein
VTAGSIEQRLKKAAYLLPGNHSHHRHRVDQWHNIPAMSVSVQQQETSIPGSSSFIKRAKSDALSFD